MIVISMLQNRLAQSTTIRQVVRPTRISCSAPKQMDGRICVLRINFALGAQTQYGQSGGVESTTTTTTTAEAQPLDQHSR